MINEKDLSDMVEAIWKANTKSLADAAEQSAKAFPQPPIMANLEVMSGNQFSKLLADVQKRSFFLGAITMAHLLCNPKDETIQ